MDSRSRQPTTAAKKLILAPVLTLKGHQHTTSSISYFPDGKRMISGSCDKTTRRWDLEAGKEIKEARNVCREEVHAVGVSRDGRWVVTGSGDAYTGNLKGINCIDISGDSTLLASGANDKTTRIWNLETGKLVAGPFKSADEAGTVGTVGTVRFSQDSKKLAVQSRWGNYLEVWDVATQSLIGHKDEVKL
ncbi:WD40 repeat-like protein [Suillus weaverae]|nr:WD40 repeat-like protein [Suillus weaverae]